MYKFVRGGFRSVEVALLWIAAGVVAGGALAFGWAWAIWPMYLIALATCVLLVVEGHRVLGDEKQIRRRRDEAPAEAAAPRPDGNLGTQDESSRA